MAGRVLLGVILLGAKLAEGYAQNDIGKCCSKCECQGYSIAGGEWTKESCCLSGNPCWCNQNNQCQPSCSSSTSQKAQLGRCFSTKDCQQYSRAGGLWTKSDCCSSHGLCWCDQNDRCQPSCSVSTSPPSSSLGNCYSTRDCQSYSVAGGKWTQVDCCSSGGRCWCDQYRRCQSSCSISTNRPVAMSNLGKCYSSHDCQQYSAAGGKWTKEDCCSSGSRCWCDGNGRCQPSCSNSTNEHNALASLGKCYSTRDCQHYSMAGGSWTKRDCCLSRGRCWCDEYGHCQPTCSTSTPRRSAFGKCYSTRDCQSYSKAGGTWTKEDCCLTGGLCWCDLNQVCQPSCSSVSQQKTTQKPEKIETPSITTQLASTYATTKPTFELSTLPVKQPSFPTQHTEPTSPTLLGKCYSSYNCQAESVLHGLWTIEHCCQSGNPCWCDLDKRCQSSCTTHTNQQNLVSETEVATFVVSTGLKPTYTKPRSLMYLWFLIILTVCPCLCCFWVCCRYKGHLPSHLSFTYVKVNADPPTSSPI